MKGIYAIRNKANGKVYIGQSRNIQKRFKQHLDALEKGKHHSKKLQKDFDEFGADKFVLELIELCKNEQLDQKEMEWITKFDSIRNGYNVQDPKTKKTWLGIKQQKRPVVTVRGELSKVLRDFALETIDVFRDWLMENKEEVRKSIVCLIGAGLFVTFIAIGDLVSKFFGDHALFLYCTFVLLSVFAIIVNIMYCRDDY